MATRTVLEEFWYRPVSGCRAEDKLSIMDDIFVVIHLCESTETEINSWSRCGVIGAPPRLGAGGWQISRAVRDGRQYSG